MLLRCVCAVLLSSLLTGCSAATSSTVEPPFELLDLETFTRLPDARPPVMRSGTMLVYDAPGKAVQSYAVLKARLAAAHWRELPGGSVSTEYESANGFFKRGDHVLTLSLCKAAEPGMVSVTMQHHGDLELSKLPLPGDAEPVYQFPHTAGYVTPAAVEDTTKAFGDAMAAAGWSVFESSPGSTTYKRGTQTVQVSIMVAPAQAGKTMIQLSPQLLPIDLPTPPEAKGIRFSHSPVALTFESSGDWDEVAKFYQSELPRLGWKPTTDSLVRNEEDAFQIYRNAAKALAQLKVETRGGKTLATLEYQSPTVFEENEKRFQEFRKQQEAKKAAKP